MLDRESLERLEQQKNAWEQKTIKKVLTKAPERRDTFYTGSNIEVERLYSELDVKEIDYSQDLGFPGQYPYTRGVQPTMYRGRFWTMRQYAGFGTAEESNQRYRYLLTQGQTGLSVALTYQLKLVTIQIILFRRVK